ncbi:MAG: thiamine diphosphokinase [Actinomycetota bacterium]|nr:thiamine diphosphokinase [Actinomycetota bacterium]
MDEAAPSTPTVVVVAGGEAIDHAVLDRLRTIEPGATTVAADSGVDLALALGRRVDVAVGDFDSVTAAGLARITGDGAEIVRHPAAKDATDLELAVDVARGMGAGRLVVLGGHGGRLDHLLANVAVLTGPRTDTMAVEAHLGPALVTVVRAAVDGSGGATEITGSIGELATLLPQHGPARGVTTSGLAYPLHDEDLAAGTSRGVSNLLSAAVATVLVRDGVVAVIQPDHHRPPEHP